MMKLAASIRMLGVHLVLLLFFHSYRLFRNGVCPSPVYEWPTAMELRPVISSHLFSYHVLRNELLGGYESCNESRNESCRV